MIDHRERWALILGASSGFGEAAALALAADGYHIAGVHLDRRQGMERVEGIRKRIEAHGSRRCSSTATPRTTTTARRSSRRWATCSRSRGRAGSSRTCGC